MAEKDKKPELRFTGFTDAWELRKLGDVTFPSGVKNSDNIPYESYSISNEKGFVPQNEQFENGGTMKDADKSMYYIVSPQSFAYNPARINVGSIGYQNLSKSVIVSSLYEVFKTTNECDDVFLWYWLKTDYFQKTIERYQEGGVRLYYYYDNFCKGTIRLPSVEEQRKIGALLTHIDKLITLQQRKLEKLKNNKTSMLQKMFPKDGADSPELRFTEFTDAWELRKLGDVTFPSGVKNSDNIPYESYSISNEKGFVPQNEQFENGGTMKDADKSMYYIVSPQSFAYNPARINVGSIGYQNLSKSVIVSSLYEVFKTTNECDDVFLWYWLKTDYFQKTIERYQEGGVRLYFYYDNFCKGTIRLPSVEEQRKIGALLTHIDKLITLQQRKLEKLKNNKTSMLQKMFV
ncbi:restriction endonuclease subunit S [Bacillus atrophaeus]|uniref:restriction endonuclease subunit S n=1 Tax=Bacillus atrophaeus TaxID=1452 RepID=UPI00227EF52A|nr:restriction endonuclease subunit S [Bacillus atrophaeus]MCY9205222.1 restriction endonuclease subunit S [Bacillus atrophaeus]MEC0883834.1 restriction endonuclease subunit S [Bacillus atrophaeus]